MFLPDRTFGLILADHTVENIQKVRCSNKPKIFFVIQLIHTVCSLPIEVQCYTVMLRGIQKCNAQPEVPLVRQAQIVGKTSNDYDNGYSK